MRKPDPAHEETDKIIEKIEKEIAKEYKKAHEEVTKKLEDYLRRFEKKDAIWRRWVREGKKTKEEYKQWRVGQILIDQRWEEMKEVLSTDYLNVHDIAESIVKGYIPEVYALNHNYATFQIEKGSLLDTSYTLYSRESVERMFRDNPKLYKKPGAKVQKQIKDGLLKKWDRRQIQSVMTQGILQGESIVNLTKRLEKVTGGEHGAAIRNARTLITGVQNAGRMDAINRANSLGIASEKQWLATLDSRTRHWHRQLDGEKKPVNEPFVNDVGKIMYPGDPKADGANLYNCRCTLMTVVKGYEIDASDISLRHNKNLNGMTYEQWKEEKKSTSNPITLPEEKANAARAAYIWEYINL